MQDCQETGVLGEVIGLFAKIFAEPGDDTTLRVFNDGAVAGGPGVAARSAVAVGGVPGVAALRCGWKFVRWKKGVGH